MRPRNYGSMNRVIAKAVSHSVNDYYRQKKKTNAYNTYNNVSKVNNTPLSASESIIASVIILIFIMFILAVSNQYQW